MATRARRITPSSRPHAIAALAYPDMAPFELSIVVEVFGLPRPELDVRSWYSLDVCAAKPGLQRAVGGIGLQVAHGLDRLAAADTVIVPGWPVHQDVPADLVAALCGVHERGGRIVSICSGAFVLAAAGLLDGRRAATHWQYADLLARRYPAVTVDRDVLYVDDTDVLTSAGSAAGIDLCLHLIRADHGPSVANQVARRLVVPAHRDGDQAQYVERPVPEPDDARIQDVLAWMTEHLAEPITVAGLAGRAAMSERHFARRFREATGTSPLDWLVGVRVQASLPLLEASDEPVEALARRVGFATAVSFRHHFRRRLSTTPTAYRRAFRQG